jgi:hypothetical protein
MTFGVRAQWELPGVYGTQNRRPEGGLGSRNRPLSCLIPGWMAQSAVVQDHRQLEVGELWGCNRSRHEAGAR